MTNDWLRDFTIREVTQLHSVIYTLTPTTTIIKYLIVQYRNVSIKRPGAYLIFCLLRGGELIREGRLFEGGAY